MTQFFNKTVEKEKRRQLRNNAPPAETILWQRLKGKHLLGYKFRRQYSVSPYVIDFYCPALKLAVEIDGDSHFEEGAMDYDHPRQAFIESFGTRFLRFTNEEVHKNLEGVLSVIVQVVHQGETPL